MDVHVHLDECEVCQQLLNEAAHALATAATAPLHEREDIAWGTTFRPGTLVGERHLITRYITRGGMGEVYEAFDRELHERVALKTVTSTACDSPAAVRALKGEVQMARRVSHPNVCRIYDIGTHSMPQTNALVSFLTMEFVEGETLGQRIRLGGALPVPEARKLARQLLLGLSAAHDAGVLHRDFKSDNVMLRNEGAEGVTPLIMDFGLARKLDHDSMQDAVSSSNASLLGTLGYIAPEQFDGKSHSKASDVYAFGIVWFEMLTGESPFASSAAAELTIFERFKRGAPPPSSKNSQVPKGLDEIVLGCLRQSPKDRYRTAGEVLAALDALDARENRHRSWFSQRPLIAPLAVVGFTGLGLYLARPAPRMRAPLQSEPAASSAAQPAPVPSNESLTPGAPAPAVTTPAVTTPAVTTPAVTTPAVTTPAVTTPAVTTPAMPPVLSKGGESKPQPQKPTPTPPASAPSRESETAPPSPTADEFEPFPVGAPLVRRAPY
jgi:serine/threonine protein kinase